MLEKIEQKNRRLQEEKLKEVERYIKELDKFSKSFIKNSEETGTSLKKIYEEIKGSQFVAENFEETHERVMRRLREEEERTKANEIGNLIKALNITIEKIGGKYGIDVEELKNVLSVENKQPQGEKSVKSQS
jgi:DNA-binding transcriptional MerR regulator